MSRSKLCAAAPNGVDSSRSIQSHSRFYSKRSYPTSSRNTSTAQQKQKHHVRETFSQLTVCSHSHTVLRNKFSHTLTLFFLCTYTDQWSSFFADLFTLIRPSVASSFNRHVSLLFFHLVLEISGEVADQMIKSARPSNNQIRQARDARVRDAVRERDAAQINEAVLTIVADAAAVRKSQQGNTEELVEVIDWGVRTFGSYVGACVYSTSSAPIYRDTKRVC